MEPIRVAVTGAAGAIGYALTPRVASGAAFGPDRPVILQLLELPVAMNALEGVRMELEDCAPPTLAGIVCTDDPEEAFANAQAIFLVGAKPRGKGMERKDLLLGNAGIFEVQGKAIEAAAARDARVIVVGNPCNTNCLIAMSHAPSIPAENWSAMTRLDQNRAVSALANRAGQPIRNVEKVTIWGNHSATQYPSVQHATIGGSPATKVIGDDEWLQGDFISTIQQRGKAIIDARGASSAASAAHAAIDHMREWFGGTPDGTWSSMAVPSDGFYDVPEGLVCGIPAVCRGDGSYDVVGNLDLDDFGHAAFKKTVNELSEERDAVRDKLGSR